MSKYHKGQKLMFRGPLNKKPCKVTFEKYNQENIVTVRFNQLNREKNVLATVDVSFLTIRPEKECRICKSKENRFYLENSRICGKCESKRQIIAQRVASNKLGFKNYYQLQRFRMFTSAMTSKAHQ